MIVDAHSLPDGETIETDICIVGAGTAGITLAREFIGQKFRVCLLESGGLEPDRETHELYWGENTGQTYFPLDTARARYFGGSTNRWIISIGDNCVGARMRPLDEIDFEERDWIPHSGWPFSKSHLEPFYERAQSVCKIGTISYDITNWADSNSTPLLSLNGDRVKTVIFKFGSRDPFISDYAEKIKRTEDITTYLYANVTEIETDELAKTVTRLRVACLHGNSFWVSAKVFVLAAGGIETPRLLLLSNKGQPSGLGNQNDLVGRFFMEHLHYWSGAFIPSDPSIFAKTALYNGIRRVHDIPVIGKLAFTEKILRREKMLNHCIEMIPRIALSTSIYPPILSKGVESFKALFSGMRGGYVPEGFGKHLINMITEIDHVAITTYRTMRRKYFAHLNKRRVKLFRLAHMSEQAPNPNSRVTLSRERDSLGQSRVRLNWQTNPIDILSAVRAQEILDEELRRARLGRLFIQMKDETPPSDLQGGYHHMGTTRMHIDPKKGVVDQNCKTHGISNLFIAGPSVFPTGGYANPVLTIVALTARLADHIKRIMP